MKIIFIDWKCFDGEDTKAAFKKMGHNVVPFFHEGYNDLDNPDFDKAFYAVLEREKPDQVFSYNYYPIIAKCCHETGYIYISFLYDSPYAYIFSYTLMFETNRVFLFDSGLADYFRNGGLKNVYYMTLPGVPERVDALKKTKYDQKRTTCDVSFVGALYNEAHNFYDRIDFNKNPYLDGYVNGIMDAQMKISGYNFVEELLTQEILKQLTELFPLEKDAKSIETDGFRFADYVINRKITSKERLRLLQLIGDELGAKYNVKLFTLDDKFSIPGVRNMGIASYETEMPCVFADSKINLNISLRSIKNGIPLRCMDIMSCGGFLLTNYQADFMHEFIPGEDFVYYEDERHMLDLIEYYLTHNSERKEIARNGREKIIKHFTIEAVMNRIFDIAFGE